MYLSYFRCDQWKWKISLWWTSQSGKISLAEIVDHLISNLNWWLPSLNWYRYWSLQSVDCRLLQTLSVCVSVCVCLSVPLSVSLTMGRIFIKFGKNVGTSVRLIYQNFIVLCRSGFALRAKHVMGQRGKNFFAFLKCIFLRFRAFPVDWEFFFQKFL